MNNESQQDNQRNLPVRQDERSLQTITNSIDIINHAKGMAERFGRLVQKVYDADQLGRAIDKVTQPNPTATGFLPSLIDKTKYHLQRLKDPKFYQLTEEVANGLQELDKIRGKLPLEINYAVDDSTYSTSFRGRYVAQVKIPKKDLDELLTKDGLRLEVRGFEHSVIITNVETGEEVKGRLPFLLEGARMYLDDKQQEYVFEVYTPLDKGHNQIFGRRSTKTQSQEQFIKLLNR